MWGMPRQPRRSPTSAPSSTRWSGPMRHDPTYDQGEELSRHKDLTARTGMAVYFCDPHSHFQRGTCENTNGLLRQYPPKGTNLNSYSQDERDAIAAKASAVDLPLRMDSTLRSRSSLTCSKSPAFPLFNSVTQLCCTSGLKPPSTIPNIRSSAPKYGQLGLGT